MNHLSDLHEPPEKGSISPSRAAPKVCKDIPRDLLGVRIETRLSEARYVEIVKPPAPLNRASCEYRSPIRKAIARHMGDVRLTFKHVGRFGENRYVRRGVAKDPVGLISQESG